MALSSLFTQAQLEMTMGGATRLVEISGATDTSDSVYTSFIEQVRLAAQGDVYSIMQVTFDPTDSTVPGSPVAQTRCLAIARYWAWSYGSGGTAVPEHVVQDRNLALEALRDMRAGNSALGTETEPAAQMPTQQIDMDATGPSGALGSGWTRGNWGGYC